LNFRKIVLVAIFLLLYTGFAKSTDRVMIVSAHKNIDAAKASLHKAKTLLEIDNEAHPLSKTKGINIQLKTLDNYFIVTLSPVSSAKMENKLNSIFRSRFPDSFVVTQWDEFSVKEIATSSEPKISKVSRGGMGRSQPSKQKEVSNRDSINIFGRGLDGEWLALILLAFLGLILVIRSASQINKINKLQKTLEETQKNENHYLNTIGKKYD